MKPPPSRVSLPRVGSPAIAFTDGACAGNPGPGGWGAIILAPEQPDLRAGGGREVFEIGGREDPSTNNRMELQGPISVLTQIPSHWDSVEICTDSTYVIRGITQWVWGWMKRGWVTAEGKEVSNQDLWKRLLDLSRQRKIRWHYVRGHAGNAANERVDQIAVSFSQGRPPRLFRGDLDAYEDAYEISLLPLPEDTSLPEPRPKDAAPAKPLCYLSLIGSRAERHSTWKGCEARVKGQSGARFKKAMSSEDEAKILRDWGVDPTSVRDGG